MYIVVGFCENIWILERGTGDRINYKLASFSGDCV